MSLPVLTTMTRVIMKHNGRYPSSSEYSCPNSLAHIRKPQCVRHSADKLSQPFELGRRSSTIELALHSAGDVIHGVKLDDNDNVYRHAKKMCSSIFKYYEGLPFNVSVI